MTDENPQQADEQTRKLHALYRDVAHLIQLKEASKAPRILIDGDIEVAWPASVQQQIKDRITERMAAIQTKLTDLKNVD